MIKMTVELPSAVFLRNIDGEAVSLNVEKLEAFPHLVARVFEAGAKVILTNAYNGGGTAASDSEKLAQMQKRMDAWYRGEFAVTERGSSQLTLMRECYVEAVKAATGTSEQAVDKQIKATVEAVFGKDTAAKFDKFLEALATQKAKATKGDKQQLLEAMTQKWEKAAAELAAERAKATAAIDLTGLDI
jgi:hypothetical protein